MDDIESFFYVLLYTCLVYSRAGTTLADLPIQVRQWQSESSEDVKGGFIQTPFRYKVQPWWGPPFQSLAEKVHKEFHTLWRQEFIASCHNQAAPVVDIGNFYNTLLRYIEEALIALPTDPEILENISDTTLKDRSARHQQRISRRTTAGGERPLRRRQPP